MENDNHSKNWPTIITFLTLLILFLVLNIAMTVPFFLAIAMGGILALLSFPLYKRLREKKWTPKWAAGVVTVIVALVIIIPMVLFSIVAIDQASVVVQKLTSEENISLKNVTAHLSQWEPIGTFIGNRPALEKQIKDVVQSGAKTASAAVLGLAASLPDAGLQVALALLACFFLLIDGRRFLNWLNDRIPLEWDVRMRLYSSFKDTAISVIWATLAAAGAQALLMFGTFLALGVPGAFLAGGATFIFSWIPILGSTPVWVAGGIYLYTQDHVSLMIVMIVMGIITSLVDNYIRPFILKGRNDMHPLVSLVAIFGGIVMFGIFGVIIGPILAAVLLSLLNIWPSIGKRFGMIFEPKVEIPTQILSSDSKK